MALHRETQRVYDLTTILSMERRRNQRLINSVGRLESTSSSDEQELMASQPNDKKKYLAHCSSCNYNNRRTSDKPNRGPPKRTPHFSNDNTASPCR